MPKHDIDLTHPPLVIRGYEKLMIVDVLRQRRNGKFLRVAKFVHVSLPLLSFMDNVCSITVTLHKTKIRTCNLV